jgi:glycosyltransferase involved in cell wall biosynthesis
MNIGIDARVLERKMTGIGRYLRDILYSFLNDKENKYYLISTSEINFGNDTFVQINTGKPKFPEKIYSPYWLNFVLPEILKQNSIDIFFSPNNLLPRRKLPCKSVLVIHDLLHMVDRHYHPFIYKQYLKYQLPFSISASDAIIVISESTKNDIHKYFGVDKNKIVTIYPIPDLKFKPINVQESEVKNLKEKYKLPDKYILYVGIIENRKNITGILKIADLLKTKHLDLKFVLAGRPGYGFNSIFSEIKKRESVIYLNFVEDDELVLIYNLARAFIFPSFYEGFGYPPLEAMQCGIPVLSSNSSSLKEVVGDNGFLRDPLDYQGFADDINNLISNPNLYAEMKQRSLEQAKKFCGKESIDKLHNIFSNLLKDSSYVY